MTNVNKGAAIQSGLLAGLVFVMLEMILVATVAGQSPWGPPRMIAAIVMGQGVLPPPASFDFVIIMVALMVHFVLSILLAFVFAAIVGVRRWSLAMTLVAGAIFGLIVYFINFYVMTALFPWFAMARNGISLFSHVAFGVVLAWSYYALSGVARLDREAIVR